MVRLSILLLLLGCASPDYGARTHRLRMQDHLEHLTEHVEIRDGRLSARLNILETEINKALNLTWHPDALACDGAREYMPCPCPSHR